MAKNWKIEKKKWKKVSTKYNKKNERKIERKKKHIEFYKECQSKWQLKKKIIQKNITQISKLLFMFFFYGRKHGELEKLISKPETEKKN